MELQWIDLQHLARPDWSKPKFFLLPWSAQGHGFKYRVWFTKGIRLGFYLARLGKAAQQKAPAYLPDDNPAHSGLRLNSNARLLQFAL